MCHQSVGLVQGAIEAHGISTIAISVRPEVTVNMRVPRAIYVRFPTGNPVGQPHMANQQRTILRGALRALETIRDPGTVLEMPYRWRRMPDEDPARATAPSPAAPGGHHPAGIYAEARERVDLIERRYVALMDAVDAYRTFLEGLDAEERAKDEPDSARLQAISPQLRYLAELQRALEGAAHDGLIRVSDRVIRIRHWEDGEFL